VQVVEELGPWAWVLATLPEEALQLLGLLAERREGLEQQGAQAQAETEAEVLVGSIQEAHQASMAVDLALALASAEEGVHQVQDEVVLLAQVLLPVLLHSRWCLEVALVA
jgi:hypothetical protein